MASAVAKITLPSRPSTSIRDNQTSNQAGKDLWQLALSRLSDEDRENIDVGRHDKASVLNDVRTLVEEKRQACMQKRWKYKKSNGEVIILRDVFEKVALWVEKFKQVGDNAVAYDPSHAALPWAGIRFILQTFVNDIQVFGAMAEGMETIISTITRNSILESLYLKDDTNGKPGLEEALIKVYAVVLRYLSKARRFYDRSTVTRLAMSVVQNPSTSVESYLKDMLEKQAAVDAYARLVDAECLRRLEENKPNLAQINAFQEERYQNLKTLISDLENPISRFGRQIEYLHDSLERKERLEIFRWLSTLPVRIYHQTAIKDRQPGSGQWLLRKSHFVEWQKASSSAILWLHGIPGSGKTKLIASIIDFLQREISPSSQRAPFAFFYCARSAAEPQRSDPNEVLRSLLKQLSCTKPDEPVWEPVVDTFKQRKEEAEEDGSEVAKLSLSECHAMIEKFLDANPAIIVIDALDEIDPEKRHELLIALDTLIQKSPNVIKVLVSSRDDNDIVCQLKNVPNVYIRAADNREDIARFINAEVEQAIKSKRLLHGDVSGELREQMCRTLEEMAEGMFRWVSLQLQNLCDPRRMKHEADVRKELGRLPKTLAQLYALNYNQIMQLGPQSRLVAEKSLKWLLWAHRKLTSEEFIAAISVDSFGQSVKLSVIDVLNICCNFVVFNIESDSFGFAHLSVKEYLETRDEYSEGQSNALIVERCLDILAAPESHRQLPDATTEKNRILRSYATMYWPAHYGNAGKDVLGKTIHEKMISFLFEGNLVGPSFSSWVDCLDIEVIPQVLRDDRLRRCSSRPRNPLFVACAFGFNAAVRKWGVFGKVDINQRNQSGHTALHIAAAYGHEELLIRLIENHAEIDPNDNADGITPLHLASLAGYVEAMRLLLENGSRVNERDNHRKTSLLLVLTNNCTKAEKESSISLLLHHNAALTGDWADVGAAVLHWAVSSGSFCVVEAVCRRGLDLNAKNSNGETALQAATKRRNLPIVQLLLENKADINVRGGRSSVPDFQTFGWTALEWAVDNGDVDMVKLLFHHGAVACPTRAGDSPLHRAATIGSEPIVRLFLEADFDKDAETKNGVHPLHIAAWGGFQKVVQLFLEHGVDMETKTCAGETALDKAVRNSKETVVRYLLSKGARVSPQASAFILTPGNSSLSDESKALLAKAATLKGIDESKKLMTTLTLLEELGNATDEVWSLEFSNNGSSLAAGSRDARVYLYDTKDFKQVDSIGESDGGVINLSWSPAQYQHLIVCSRQARLWDVESRTCIKMLTSSAPATCCAFAPSGEYYAVGSVDRNHTLKVYSSDGNTLSSVIPQKSVVDISISSDNAYLICIDTKNRLHVYDTAQWQKAYSLKFVLSLTSVAVGRDPRYVLVSTGDSRVRLLEIKTRETVQIYAGKKQGNIAVKSAFGGLEDEYVVSGSEDGDIFIWDRRSGFLIQRIRGAHDGCCNVCVWNPKDPTTFASGGDDRKVKIWKLQR